MQTNTSSKWTKPMERRCVVRLFSSGFEYGAQIPDRYSCAGENISPAFHWMDVPEETKSLVFILHDPDAPREGGFTHWVLYNIPPHVKRIAEKIPPAASVPGLGFQAKNSSGHVGYMGPCPPSGSHRYVAHLFALKQELNLQPGVSYQLVASAMQGKVIEEAEFMAKYANRSRSVA